MIAGNDATGSALILRTPPFARCNSIEQTQSSLWHDTRRWLVNGGAIAGRTSTKLIFCSILILSFI